MKLKEYLEPRGRQAELAKKINVAQSLISQWSTGVRRVPAERCPHIEQATNLEVTKEDLRPDVFF